MKGKNILPQQAAILQKTGRIIFRKAFPFDLILFNYTFEV